MDNPKHLLPPRSDQTVVLVAEDEVMVRNIAQIALQTEKYFVMTASNGEEALEISRKYPGTIHALLSDINMGALDGLQLCEKLMKERPGIKVLLMSGFVQPPARIPFLQKPFKIEELKRRMRELCGLGASNQLQAADRQPYAEPAPTLRRNSTKLDV